MLHYLWIIEQLTHFKDMIIQGVAEQYLGNIKGIFPSKGFKTAENHGVFVYLPQILRFSDNKPVVVNFETHTNTCFQNDAYIVNVTICTKPSSIDSVPSCVVIDVTLSLLDCGEKVNEIELCNIKFLFFESKNAHVTKQCSVSMGNQSIELPSREALKTIEQISEFIKWIARLT